MENHICPVWIGYLLASPVRRLWQNPDKILQEYVHEGMICLDIGSAMGFFSLSMAKLVGDSGKVIAVDLQEGMINSLKQRAAKRNLLDRMDPRICTVESLMIDDLNRTIDFALAFAVVHEVPDQLSLFKQIYQSLKEGGKLLFSEPSNHVSLDAFNESLYIANKCGFKAVDQLNIKRGISVLFEK